MTHYRCPICGFAELASPPQDHYACPCCGTIFGFHDEISTNEELRRRWINGGKKWSSEKWAAPPGWDPVKQLAQIDVLVIEIDLDYGSNLFARMEGKTHELARFTSDNAIFRSKRRTSGTFADSYIRGTE